MNDDIETWRATILREMDKDFGDGPSRRLPNDVAIALIDEVERLTAAVESYRKKLADKDRVLYDSEHDELREQVERLRLGLKDAQNQNVRLREGRVCANCLRAIPKTGRLYHDAEKCAEEKA
jgi:hypothetical protein